MKRICRTTAALSSVLCLLMFVSCPRNRDPVAGERRTFDGIAFQWCPAGTFDMGSPESEEGRGNDETRHEVTLTKGFWLGTYEVTRRQWAEVVLRDFSVSDPTRAEFASWEDAQEFLAELNNGRTQYRLPTEAEWEYACRAGTRERFYWGEDRNETDIDDYAWYEENYEDETWLEVGGRLPNRWGLYDMSGNLWECCQDQYGPYPEESVTDPQGPDDDGGNVVLRGGYWGSDAAECRSANRRPSAPDNHGNTIGFRVLRES